MPYECFVGQVSKPIQAGDTHYQLERLLAQSVVNAADRCIENIAAVIVVQPSPFFPVGQLNPPGDVIADSAVIGLCAGSHDHVHVLVGHRLV